jgi:hypothetical protein
VYLADVPLPCALRAVQERFPWESIAAGARQRLGERIPALEPFLAGFSDAVFGLSSGFFYLPAAQAIAWGVTDEQVLRNLLEALALGHFHFAWQDRVIDEGIADPVMCLVSDGGLLGYLDALDGLGGAGGARYRQLHDRYYARYVAAMARDLRHRRGVLPYDSDDVLGLGDKAAPGVTVIHLIADLANRPTSGERGAEALLRLCAGLQLLDDRADASHDAEVGNLTWPVTAALEAYPELARDDAEGVRAAVVGSGAGAACVRLARTAFRDARREAEEAGAMALADLADVWERRCTGWGESPRNAEVSSALPGPP